MDKKLIEQYGEDILSYRLRTARQKKRMQYEDFDKQLLNLHREQLSLYNQKNALGWEPLIPSVQKGWKRFFILREDVAVGKQAHFFGNILRKINTYDWSYRKDFMVRKRRYGRNKYGVKTQKLLEPSEQHFRKLRFTETEQQLFREVRYRDHKGHITHYYVFNEPWRFVLCIRPNIIDKVKKRDAVIEARIQAIRDYLHCNSYDRRMDRLVYGSTGTRWWKREERFPYVYKNKSLSQILDLIND